MIENEWGRRLTTTEYDRAIQTCRENLSTDMDLIALIACVDAAKEEAAINACWEVPVKAAEEKAPKPRSEAEINLNKIAKNAKTNYMATGEYPKGRASVLPNVRCCAQPAGKCAVTDAWMKDPVWYEIEFAPDVETMFQYSYESPDGQSFVATAIGDLDCDGTPGVWTMTGTATNGNNPSVTLKPPPKGVY